ncbi:MAG: DegT/DnrJ/EryC1/StrS family aminotransferase [Gaiellaceae bacterium]
MIPVNEPALGSRELEYVRDCIESGWISSEGDYVGRFERGWANYCGVAHGVAVSSGTAALFAAVAALGLGPGDEIILPSFTIVCCAHAVTAVGATPVLVDSEPATWCMDVAQVASKITARTRAIMPVHIYGHPVDMAPLREHAERHGLALIEDAAEAHGAEYRGARAGSLGNIGCFSFYTNKIVTTGEGGMVVTDDGRLAQRVRSYADLGFRPERRFYHTDFGHNHRLTNLQAAVGVAQLESIEWRVERKRAIGRLYVELLRDVPGVQLPVEMPWAKNVYWMVGIVVDEELGVDAVELARRLQEQGVGTRPFFLGMHEQPVFLDRGLFVGEHYPVAERIARQGLYLPSGLTLADTDIELVADRVTRALGE